MTNISLCEAILEREAQETRDCTDIFAEYIRQSSIYERARWAWLLGYTSRVSKES